MKIIVFALVVFLLYVFVDQCSGAVGTQVQRLDSCGTQCDCHNPSTQKPSKLCGCCKTTPCGQTCPICGKKTKKCKGKNYPAGGLLAEFLGGL